MQNKQKTSPIQILNLDTLFKHYGSKLGCHSFWDTLYRYLLYRNIKMSTIMLTILVQVIRPSYWQELPNHHDNYDCVLNYILFITFGRKHSFEFNQDFTRFKNYVGVILKKYLNFCMTAQAKWSMLQLLQCGIVQVPHI